MEKNTITLMDNICSLYYRSPIFPLVHKAAMMFSFCHPFHTLFIIISWGPHFNLPFFPAHVAQTVSRQTPASKNLCRTCVFTFNSSPYTQKLMGSLFHSSSTFPEVFLSKDHHIYEIMHICIHTNITASSLCAPPPQRTIRHPVPSFPLCQGSPLFPCTCGCNPPAILASAVDFNCENPLKQSCGSEQLL